MTQSKFTYNFANKNHKSPGAWYAFVSYDSGRETSEGITIYVGQRGHWFNPLKWEIGINLDLSNKIFDLNLGIFYLNIMIG